jgi:hypothetical protein
MNGQDCSRLVRPGNRRMLRCMTQAVQFGLTWTQIAWAICGVVIALGGLVGVHKLQERRREARGERPPQSEKILRPAGWSAMLRLNDLFDGLMFMALQVVFGAVFVGLGIGCFFPVVSALRLGQVTLAQLRDYPNAHVFVSALLFFAGALGWTGVRVLQSFWGLRADEELAVWAKR